VRRSTLAITLGLSTLVLGGLVLRAGLGERVWLAVRGLAGKSGAKPAAAASPGNTLKQDYVITLADGEGDRFVRMSVVIEMDSDGAKQELEVNNTRLRDAFIARVADCGSQDFAGQEGIEKGRHLLREAITEASPGSKVKGVYFLEFLPL
jgi:flagellar basal body-associated protein FliL